MDQPVGSQHKVCPWCKQKVVMVCYPRNLVLGHNVKIDSLLVFMPVCPDCIVDKIHVAIAVDTVEEAWERWDKIQ